LHKRDRILESAPPPRGIVRTPHPSAGSEYRRILPCNALAETVAHFWWVRWNCPTPLPVQTLPHPCVQMVFEWPAGTAQVAGVHRGVFSRRLEGAGRVFGIKFRPGMFQHLFGRTMRALANRTASVGSVFGNAGRVLAHRLDAADLDCATAVRVAEDFLMGQVKAADPEQMRLRDWVERWAADPALCRVEQAAALGGVDVRTLQRRCLQYVGASPKWILRVYRLHEALERLRAGQPCSLARVAADLGYSDQAHFSRDFKALVGCAPGDLLHERVKQARA
jgi:AraC-like DNA-binding protein